MVKVIGLYKDSEKSATLNKVHLKAYWADEDGNKIDKGYFGSTVRLYIEEYWAYNVLLKIFLKQEDFEEVIFLDMLKNIIPAYFFQMQNYLEVCLKQSYDYKFIVPKRNKTMLWHFEWIWVFSRNSYNRFYANNQQNSLDGYCYRRIRCSRSKREET